ncbi:MAG: phytanoyl-CoA dioxygenase family protein [Candidatus Latescibacterota bacterium]|jgi:phytanoyl-CoA hydroxylase
MDLHAAKRDFYQRGFAVLRGFIDARELAAINAELERYITEALPSLPETAAFYEDKDDPTTLMRLQGMCDYDSFFHDLYYGERMLELGDLLMDGAIRGKNMQWFNKLPLIGKETPPHQDGFYFMLEPNEALTMWLAQDTVDEENGCVRYLPGSHREGMRPHQRTDILGFSQGISDYGAEDRRCEVPICAEPGDLLVHHSLTVHRADANPSPRPRRALGLVYFAERAQENAERADLYRQQLYTEWEKAGKI